MTVALGALETNEWVGVKEFEVGRAAGGPENAEPWLKARDCPRPNVVELFVAIGRKLPAPRNPASDAWTPPPNRELYGTNRLFTTDTLL